MQLDGSLFGKFAHFDSFVIVGGSIGDSIGRGEDGIL